jgi:hypothetical protein
MRFVCIRLPSITPREPTKGRDKSVTRSCTRRGEARGKGRDYAREVSRGRGPTVTELLMLLAKSSNTLEARRNLLH